MSALTARLKNLGLSDRLIRRNPILYARVRHEVRKFDDFGPQGRKQWREDRLQQLLAAARRSDYGGKVRGGQTTTDWPILEKESVRQAPQAFIATPRWRSVSASTSGTSGTPLQLRRSFSNVVYEQLILDRLVASAGLPLTRCRAAVLRGDDVKPQTDRAPPFWQVANGGKRLLFSSNHLDAQSIEHFVAALRDFAPQVLFAYPTVLDSLCSLMLRRGDQLQIPLTACGSEVLTKATCDLAQQTLQTQIIGYYGQAERVAWARGNPYTGYRFEPTYSVNELHLTGSEDDLDIYEIIGTGLWNDAMPLVRYRTGDQIRVRKGADPAAIAEGRQSFASVIGRNNDYIVAPSGAHLMGIDHIPRNVPHVVRTQFIQDSVESVTMLVIPAPGFDEQCRKLLLEHASMKLPPSMRVRIEETTELLRTGAGKAPLVIRKIDGVA